MYTIIYNFGASQIFHPDYYDWYSDVYVCVCMYVQNHNILKRKKGSVALKNRPHTYTRDVVVYT